MVLRVCKRAFIFSAVLFFFFAAAFSAFSSHALCADTSVPVSENIESPFAYVIGPQNVLQIKIFGDASTNQIYRVDELGLIKHAFLGSVKIGGLSVSQAEELIEKKLSGDYIIDPRVTIFVLEHSRFSVIGEVKRPGTYEIQGKVSIIEAISLAGGFSTVANQRGVKIIRKKDGTESTIDVDSTRVTQQGDTSANVFIEADDVVVVSKSFF
jgi:polysaccharide export outer membrane protein